jgi:polysaccharide export outer membrane protein
MFRRVICLIFILYCLAAMAIGPTRALASNGYTIGPGDKLAINVYGHEDLTRTVLVDGAGNISYPLIGMIQAQGLSVIDLAEIITRELAAGYIINPQVTVAVEEYRSSKATILGKVRNPALYELRGRTTLLELISTAGGLEADAGQYAFVTRRESSSGGDSNGGRKEIIRIDLRKLVEEGDTTQNIIITDGDSIFISKMEKVYVTGEVKAAGAYPYEDGLTVIMALTNARGLTDLAAPGKIRIIRKNNGQEKVLNKVQMDDLVQPEDVIVVPERFF